MRTIVTNNKGVTLIAAIVAVFLMASLGAALAYIVTSNNQSVIQQVTSDQSYYSVQAGMEYALKQSLDGFVDTAWNKNFAGGAVNIAKAGGIITINGTKINAEETHSIADPTPPSANCLEAVVGSANVTGSTLSGITVNKKSGCNHSITITSMTGTSWSPNAGELLTTIQFNGGTNFSGSGGSGGTFGLSPTFTINNFQDKTLDMVWNSTMLNHTFTLVFNYTYQSQPYSLSVNVDLSNAAACFAWGTSGARLTYDSNLWHWLTGTTVGNSCTMPITVSSMVVSWSPTSPSRNLTNMVVNGTSVFSGTSASGAASTTNFSIPASTTRNFNRFVFSDEMLGRNYSITWNFSDGTSASTSLNLFASPQDTCLTIDISNALVNPSNLKQITGLTIQNTCGEDIGMTGLTMSWAGETGQRLTQARIVDTDGNNTYSGNYASGVLMDFGGNDLYVRDGDAASAVTSLTFLNNVTSIERTLTFAMSDGTTKSVTFTPNSEANCISLNAVACSLSANNRDLQSCTISNSCGSPIVWAQTTVSWSPTSPARNLTQLRVNNSNVWSGTASSGTTINNNDVTINAGATRTINRFRWNSSVSGRAFTIVFVMLDGSSNSVTVGPF